MKGSLLSAAIGATMVSGLLAVPAGPVRLSPEAARQAIAELEKDRAETRQWLQRDPTSYLATINRRDFEQRKTLTVGRASDNDLRIDDGAIAAHHLRVTVQGERFQIDSVDPGARFLVGKDERRAANVEPSNITIGRFLLRLSHQGFPGLIVFDPQSPRFASYKGLDYFPPDLSYRYELPLTKNPAPNIVIIMSTRGNQRRAQRVGWFEFLVGKTAVRLEAMRLLEPGVGENDLGIFFRDLTTGKETYELGRYVDVKKLESGAFLLDFNAAYNPACAFSDHYNCPIPSRGNTLPVAIRAGEMDSHYHEVAAPGTPPRTPSPR